jgi:hypothetical protein
VHPRWQLHSTAVPPALDRQSLCKRGIIAPCAKQVELVMLLASGYRVLVEWWPAGREVCAGILREEDLAAVLVGAGGCRIAVLVIGGNFQGLRRYHREIEPLRPTPTTRLIFAGHIQGARARRGPRACAPPPRLYGVFCRWPFVGCCVWSVVKAFLLLHLLHWHKPHFADLASAAISAQPRWLVATNLELTCRCGLSWDLHHGDGHWHRRSRVLKRW